MNLWNYIKRDLSSIQHKYKTQNHKETELERLIILKMDLVHFINEVLGPRKLKDLIQSHTQ